MYMHIYSYLYMALHGREYDHVVVYKIYDTHTVSVYTVRVT